MVKLLATADNETIGHLYNGVYRRAGNFEPKMRRVFPPSDAAKVAALLDREDALISLAHAVIEFAPNERADIDRELAEIRTILEPLGFRRTA